MPRYTVYLKDKPGTVFAPPNPSRGDQILLVERPLFEDRNTQNQVGTLTARLTVMERSSSGDLLVLGNADHHLAAGRHPGMVSVQGSWRFSDTARVFAIIGGTGKTWHAARGTVTFQDIDATTEQIIYDWT